MSLYCYLDHSLDLFFTFLNLLNIKTMFISWNDRVRMKIIVYQRYLPIAGNDVIMTSRYCMHVVLLHLSKKRKYCRDTVAYMHVYLRQQCCHSCVAGWWGISQYNQKRATRQYVTGEILWTTPPARGRRPIRIENGSRERKATTTVKNEFSKRVVIDLICLKKRNILNRKRRNACVFAIGGFLWTRSHSLERIWVGLRVKPVRKWLILSPLQLHCNQNLPRRMVSPIKMGLSTFTSKSRRKWRLRMIAVKRWMALKPTTSFSSSLQKTSNMIANLEVDERDRQRKVNFKMRIILIC